MNKPVPIACSLDADDLELRRRRLAELGAALVGLRVDGRTASLRFKGGREAELAELVEAESRCCPFFELAIEPAADGESRLRVGAPPEAEWAVRGLVAGFVRGWDSLLEL